MSSCKVNPEINTYAKHISYLSPAKPVVTSTEASAAHGRKWTCGGCGANLSRVTQQLCAIFRRILTAMVRLDVLLTTGKFDYRNNKALMNVITNDVKKGIEAINKAVAKQDAALTAEVESEIAAFTANAKKVIDDMQAALKILHGTVGARKSDKVQLPATEKEVNALEELFNKSFHKATVSSNSVTPPATEDKPVENKKEEKPAADDKPVENKPKTPPQPKAEEPQPAKPADAAASAIANSTPLPPVTTTIGTISEETPADLASTADADKGTAGKDAPSEEPGAAASANQDAAASGKVATPKTPVAGEPTVTPAAVTPNEKGTPAAAVDEAGEVEEVNADLVKQTELRDAIDDTFRELYNGTQKKYNFKRNLKTAADADFRSPPTRMKTVKEKIFGGKTEAQVLADIDAVYYAESDLTNAQVIGKIQYGISLVEKGIANAQATSVDKIRLPREVKALFVAAKNAVQALQDFTTEQAAKVEEELQFEELEEDAAGADAADNAEASNVADGAAAAGVQAEAEAEADAEEEEKAPASA